MAAWMGLLPSTPASAQTVGAPDSAGDTDGSNRSVEQRIVDLLDGCVFEGRYTTDNTPSDANGSSDEPDGPSQPGSLGGRERYTIESCRVTDRDEVYALAVRIQYGGKDVRVPLEVRIVMADQTPVITLDQVWIPGLGTFDARVLIRQRRYAGTWSHDALGGHLFGRIEPLQSGD